ncbi:MAG: hypothetical protein NTV30_09425 [Chloroflexi bacterium]|nr:hypothetical protein [Chloroflexota bacterium]
MHRRKGILFLSLILCLALVLVGTGTAFANGKCKSEMDFNSTLTITSFAPAVYGTNYFPIMDKKGNIKGWDVVDRDIYGTMTGGLEGSYTITYSGKLDLFEQGNIEGTLEINTSIDDKPVTIYGDFKASTYLLNTIDPVYGPIPYQDESGLYFSIAFTTKKLKFKDFTGDFKNISGTGSFEANPGNPIKAYILNTGEIQVANGCQLNLQGNLKISIPK